VIEIPLLFFFIMPKTAVKATKPMNKWINKNGSYLIAGFLLIIGIYVIFNGAGKLGLF
jgi:cell division protein FtsW (lipid II flippase)